MEENRSMVRSNWQKDNKNGGRSTNKSIINYRKASADSCWESSTSQANFGDGGDLLGEFPWPPRSYTCTFCKREFRSAQALGGHMNVHRREKARLRQITPQKIVPIVPTCLNLDQNPNPNIATTFALNTSSYPFRSFPYPSKPPPLISPPHSSEHTYSSSLVVSAPRYYKLCPSDGANFTAMRSKNSDLTVDEFDDYSHEKECLIVKKSGNGSLVYSKFDDLDLELRLGYS
ncbi:hypothetical protein L1887_32733 [Cichorium endivia]|nr:hypothetical protein L1887_32733 [Cichorium endivia]